MLDKIQISAEQLSPRLRPYARPLPTQSYDSLSGNCNRVPVTSHVMKSVGVGGSGWVGEYVNGEMGVWEERWRVRAGKVRTALTSLISNSLSEATIISSAGGERIAEPKSNLNSEPIAIGLTGMTLTPPVVVMVYFFRCTTPPHHAIGNYNLKLRFANRYYTVHQSKSRCR